jgi:hypothetical protein
MHILTKQECDVGLITLHAYNFSDVEAIKTSLFFDRFETLFMYLPFTKFLIIHFPKSTDHRCRPSFVVATLSFENSELGHIEYKISNKVKTKVDEGYVTEQGIAD